jgi:hypothetical protein
MLSVVAGSRNDGHGQHLTERTQVFVDGLAHQAERYKRDVELILVEWNPPANLPRLAEVLQLPSTPHFQPRVVTVPREVHREVDPTDRLPFYQMIAKNVGIRRARGENVLATNIDIILSDELFLASTAALRPRTLYRADRVDVPFDPSISTDPEVVKIGAPLRVNRKNGIHYPGRGLVHPHYRGWSGLIRLVPHPWRVAKTLVKERPVGEVRDKSRNLVAPLRVLLLPSLHTNACGDFTLLTSDSWAELAGYPEWPFYSWNLDSLFLYQAAAAGFAFVDLSAPAFHMEHSAGWSPESESQLFSRLVARGVPVLTNAGLAEVAHSFRSRNGAVRWRVNVPRCWGHPGPLPDTSEPESGHGLAQ